MAGTNAVAVKRALVEALRAAPEIEAFDDPGVQVEYAYPGEIDRHAIYLGRVTFTHSLMAFKSATAPRIARDERGTVRLYIRAYVPGDRGEQAEERAVEIGTIVEQLLAGNPRQDDSGVPGLLLERVVSGELLSTADDDAGIAMLIYQVEFRSQLT